MHMKKIKFPLTIIALLLLTAISAEIQGEAHDVTRSDFPQQFLFGAATSAYQIEGACREDGKGLSNWDAFCRIRGNIADGRNGDVAADHYHRYMEDIEIMHSLGLTAYRFSISWSRILPRGRLGGVNQAAVIFYNNIIDNLLLRGIEPFVTIFHNEFPQEFEDRFRSWLSPRMQEEFVHFAKTCFDHFADRVKYWSTINEPNLFSQMAYGMGLFPPSHCSPPFGNCATGNSDVEPLIVAHNILLAHAKAAKLFRERYKSELDGELSITVCAFMYVPLTNSTNDIEAVNRALAFNVAWTLDPIVFGDYPKEMKRYLGSDLPTFTLEERALLKDSIDFIGVNHYSTLYAKDCIHSSCLCNDSSCIRGGDRPIQGFVQATGVCDGIPIGERTGMAQFFVVPKGMDDIVLYIKERYRNKPMYITENGYSFPVDEYDDYQHDLKRVHYHRSYLAYLAKAMRRGADIRGYFVWSLMDNFEWNSGYRTKFGIYHIDPSTLNRIPKLSARWYRDFLTNSSTIVSLLESKANADYNKGASE